MKQWKSRLIVLSVLSVFSVVILIPSFVWGKTGGHQCEGAINGNPNLLTLYVLDVGILEIPVLDHEEYLTFGSHLHQQFRDSAQRQAALSLIYQFDSSLKRLSLQELSLQLRSWVSIRSHMPIETIEDVMASNLLGVLITDVASHALLEVEFTLSQDNSQTIQLDRWRARVLYEIERSCATNVMTSILLRSHLPNIFNVTGDIETILSEVVQEAEERSREHYTKKRGHNPLAMSRLDQKTSKGLKSLCEHTSTNWEEIVNQPAAFHSKAYFTAVDLYISQSFLEIYSLLSSLGLTRSVEDEQEYETYKQDVWYKRFIREPKELREIQSIVTIDRSWFENYNKLLLLGEK